MPPKGLYLPDGSLMRWASRNPIRAEIASRSRSLDYFALNNLYLPNPDPILKAKGKDIRVYEDLISDDRVGGSIVNRVNATLALDWEIDRGQSSKSRRARAIKEIFSDLPLNTIIEQLIRGARGFGYCPTETIWAPKNGLNVPVAIVPKPQHWFVFGQENDLRFLSRESLFSGEALPPRRFLCPTNEATYANPYGLGLLSRCFWPVIFKRGGWRFWVQFSERYGQVWPIGKLPRSANPKDVDDLLDILEQMIQDGLAVIPDDGSVDFKESGTKSATADLYRGIIAEANNAISTVWLGHAGAGESVRGELGGKDIALEIRTDLRDADKTLVEETFNLLIDWICEENWGSSVDAPRFSLWEEEDVDLDQAKRDADLTKSLKASDLRLTQRYFERTYNLEAGDLEKADPRNEENGRNEERGTKVEGFSSHLAPRTSHLVSSCPHCFEAPTTDLTETQIAERLAIAADPATTAWVDKLRDLTMAATSLPELQAAIATAFPGMDSNALAGIMAEEMTRAIMAGRLDVENGD